MPRIRWTNLPPSLRQHLFDRVATLAAAPDVVQLLAAELGWDAAEGERQLTDYHDLVARELAEVR